MADRINSREYWDKKWSHKKRRVEKYSMQRAWDLINMLNPKSILDVGCGNGKLLVMVATGRRCFGIDISEVAINHLKKVYGLDGLAMDLYDLDKVDIGTFDFIVCNHTLEHLIRDRFALELMKDKLNIGGTFFCAVPDNISSPEETEEHCQMYNRESLCDLLTDVFGNATMSVVGHHLLGVSKKC